MPFFDGLPLFGSAVTMRTSENPRAGQKNAYGGLSGVEHLDQGLRGRFTECEFWYICDSTAALNNAELLIRSYRDGRSYILIDQFGNTWDNVLLDSFEATTKVYINAATGVVMRKYSARFDHLT